MHQPMLPGDPGDNPLGPSAHDKLPSLVKEQQTKTESNGQEPMLDRDGCRANQGMEEGDIKD